MSRLDPERLVPSAKLAIMEQMYREQVLLRQNRWLVSRIQQKLPELRIENPDGNGWHWTYRCAEQESDGQPTVLDCLVDFLESTLTAIDLGVFQRQTNKGMN